MSMHVTSANLEYPVKQGFIERDGFDHGCKINKVRLVIAYPLVPTITWGN